MNELFSRISNQLTDYWNKFNKSQKIRIVIIAVCVLSALSVFIYIFTRPKMVTLSSGLSMSDAASIKSVLDEKGIHTQESTDGSTISVDSKQLTDAKYALAESNIPDSGFTYEDAYNSSIYENETIKKDKLKRVKQDELAKQISLSFQAIDDAVVQLVIPDYDRFYVNSSRESSASIILTTRHDLNQEQILSIVRFVKYSIENLKSENISITDQNANLLYNGEDEKTSIGSLTKRQNIEENKKNEIKRDVENHLKKFYNDVSVIVNLSMDFDEFNAVKEMHVNPLEDSATGLVTEEEKQSSSSKNDVSGNPPGIDSNPGETQYQVSSAAEGSESKSENYNKKYIYDSTKTQEVKSIGNVLYDDSSISIVVFNNKIYDQKLLEDSEQLKDITWEQFKAENNKIDTFEVDKNIVDAIKLGTGINNVSILGKIQPQFIDKEIAKKPIKEYILIGVVALILLLLCYVIYKGTEPVEITEIEPELSVEDLLSKSLDEEVEEIQDDDKSGIKKEIERFVEEKPEAAAQLLRNWLNEDWE